MSEPMTKELDKTISIISSRCARGVCGMVTFDASWLSEKVEKLGALAREGLRLRESPIDGDYLRQLREFDCGCETCARTAAVCPATASSLFQEVAILREHRDGLTSELDSLRKDKLGLEAASAAMEKQMERYRGFPQAHAVAECVGAIRTAIDSAMRKESK